MNKKFLITNIALLPVLFFNTACSKDEAIPPIVVEPLPELPEVGMIHKYKAPLYWSVYEYCYELEKRGVGASDMDISPFQWDDILDWVSRELLPYGYDMVCTDGFIPMEAKDASGYMTHYGSTSLKDLVSKCKEKGLRLGIYDNPLWIHGADNTKIPGTNYTFANLHYSGKTPVRNPNSKDLWFSWVAVENPGAREYIEGFFKHYSDLGVQFIRMDFLSWFEDGQDRGMGIVGKGYGRESYERALAYIAESAEKYGIFTSLVMPHLYNDAEYESKYGNMFRIVADTGDGGWSQCSARDRGKAYPNWPNCNNMFDGFIYWSHLSGRNKVILDGDFIRLNKFETDSEKEFVISLQLMAGGPVAVADQRSTIGENTKYYTNEELLDLNKDGFVGYPVSDKLGDPDNEIWVGQLTSGDYVIGIFNRSDNSKSYSYSLTDIGLSGEYSARDLWSHADEGLVSSIDVSVAPHGCKILRLSKNI